MHGDTLTWNDTSTIYRVTHPYWVIDELCIGDTAMFSADNNRETKACMDICRACFYHVLQDTGENPGVIDFRILKFEEVSVGPLLEIRQHISRYSRPSPLM
ncbi:MAG: hypothetical protein ABI716_00225 [Candidatus Saccharibacteria bacterium]